MAIPEIDGWGKQPFVPCRCLLWMQDLLTQISGQTKYLASDDSHAFTLSQGSNKAKSAKFKFHVTGKILYIQYSNLQTINQNTSVGDTLLAQKAMHCVQGYVITPASNQKSCSRNQVTLSLPFSSCFSSSCHKACSSVNPPSAIQNWRRSASRLENRSVHKDASNIFECSYSNNENNANQFSGLYIYTVFQKTCDHIFKCLTLL